MTTAPKLPEGFQALRDATAAVLAPIGNMTDRHTAVLRTMERRLAFQQACGPYTIDALLRALSDAQAALQQAALRYVGLFGELQRSIEANEALLADAARYRWLREQEWYESDLCVLCDPKRVLTRGIGLGADCPSHDRLDAAIDSALALAEKEAK